MSYPLRRLLVSIRLTKRGQLAAFGGLWRHLEKSRSFLDHFSLNKHRHPNDIGRTNWAHLGTSGALIDSGKPIAPLRHRALAANVRNCPRPRRFRSPSVAAFARMRQPAIIRIPTNAATAYPWSVRIWPQLAASRKILDPSLTAILSWPDLTAFGRITRSSVANFFSQPVLTVQIVRAQESIAVPDPRIVAPSRPTNKSHALSDQRAPRLPASMVTVALSQNRLALQ
jgi:hypothetical protein